MKFLCLVFLLAGKAVSDGVDDDLTQSIRNIFDVDVEENGNFASSLLEHVQTNNIGFSGLPAPRAEVYTENADDDVHMPIDQFAEMEMEADTGLRHDSDHLASSFRAPDSLDKDLHLFIQPSDTSDPLAKDDRQPRSLALGSDPERQQQIRTQNDFAAPALLVTKTVAAPALTSIPVKTDNDQAVKAELLLRKSVEISATPAAPLAKIFFPNQVLGVAPAVRMASTHSVQPELVRNFSSATQSSVSRTAQPAFPTNPMLSTAQAKQTFLKGVRNLVQAVPVEPAQIQQTRVVSAVAPTKRESVGLQDLEKGPISNMRVGATVVGTSSVPVASDLSEQPTQSLAGVTAAVQVNPVKKGQLKASTVSVQSQQILPKQYMLASAVEQGSAALTAEKKIGVATTQANALSAALPPMTSNGQPARSLAGTAKSGVNSVQSGQPMIAPVVSPTKWAQLKQDSSVLPLKQTSPDALPVESVALALRPRSNAPPSSLLPLPVAPVLSAQPSRASVGMAAAAPMNPVQNGQLKSAVAVVPSRQPQPARPSGLQVEQASSTVPAGSLAPTYSEGGRLPQTAMLPVHATPSVQRAGEQRSVEAALGAQARSGNVKVEPAGLPVSKSQQPKRSAFVSPVMPVQPNPASTVLPAWQMPSKQANRILRASQAVTSRSMQPVQIPAALPSMQIVAAQTLPPMPAPVASLLKQLPVSAVPVTATAHVQTSAASLLAKEKQEMAAEAAGLKADLEEVRGLLKETQVAMKSVRMKHISQEVVETKSMQSSNASNRQLRLREQTTATAEMKDTWTWRFFSQLRSIFAAPAYTEAPLVQQPASKPRSLANFWLPDSAPLAHTSAMALLAVQKPEVHHRHRHPDFMELQTLADDMHDVQISEPFAELEDEDRQELRRWAHLDKDVKQQALMLDKSAKQSPEVVAMLHGGRNHISAIWGHLEKQDESIQERIAELDDPRQRPDLRKYQQLNQLQDDSMELLESNLQHASPRLRHSRRHH